MKIVLVFLVRRWLVYLLCKSVMGGGISCQPLGRQSENNRNYKGINFFNKDDLAILLSVLRGEFNITGFRNKNLQKFLGFTGNKISRLIKRLRVHGLIKKATDSYKYYITIAGKETVIMAQKSKS